MRPRRRPLPRAAGGPGRPARPRCTPSTTDFVAARGAGRTRKLNRAYKDFEYRGRASRRGPARRLHGPAGLACPRKRAAEHQAFSPSRHLAVRVRACADRAARAAVPRLSVGSGHPKPRKSPSLQIPREARTFEGAAPEEGLADRDGTKRPENRRSEVISGFPQGEECGEFINTNRIVDAIDEAIKNTREAIAGHINTLCRARRAGEVQVFHGRESGCGAGPCWRSAGIRQC